MGIPKDLKESLLSHKVIPFVGAGVSMAVTDKDSGHQLYPSWRELLLRAADRLEKEQKPKDANLVRASLDLDEPDYSYAAKKAYEGLKGSRWIDFLKDNIDYSRNRIDNESLRLAQLVWKLGSNLEPISKAHIFSNR